MENTDIHTDKREKLLHYTMSFAGGIFAVFAILEYSNIFASAETVNMISFVEDLFGRNIFNALARAVNIVIYALGVALAAWFAKYRPSAGKAVSIAIDAVAAAVLCFIQSGKSPVAALYPAVFAMSVQFSTFRGVGKNPSSTTFSTANFRQLVTNLFNYATGKKSEDLSNFKFYAYTMLAFHLGVVTVNIVRPYMHHLSILTAYVPLLAAAVQEYAIISEKKPALK